MYPYIIASAFPDTKRLSTIHSLGPGLPFAVLQRVGRSSLAPPRVTPRKFAHGTLLAPTAPGTVVPSIPDDQVVLPTSYERKNPIENRRQKYGNLISWAATLFRPSTIYSDFTPAIVRYTPKEFTCLGL
jgi:hypothetical protein